MYGFCVPSEITKYYNGIVVIGGIMLTQGVTDYIILGAGWETRSDCSSECIACHEDTSPRSHTVTFVNKTHGLESRWNRTSCQTCHKQDFCDSCHETAYPMSHARANFASGVQTDAGSHCGTSCVIPVGSWSNTPSKNCIVCHKTRPVTKAGALHTMK